jgi:DNA-binding GntR family transcriptional regulator
MIFHYHYQWSKADEKERNIVAIGEHLAYIAALKSRDREAIMAASQAHMRTARATLLRSIGRGGQKAGLRRCGRMLFFGLRVRGQKTS